ncbi:hypothetical protein BASA83_006240 [Batrachochytrium salamandrivorans]|nr:hypothetical protein BASA83_006240 [Batrachochytrium salamandrivorans]
MPSSSFLVRGIGERIRDLPMQAEMKAHSHRAVPNVSSPICNEFNPPKIQIIRSGFGQNHHLVSRPSRELPQMGGGRQVLGPNPFLASTYQRIPAYTICIDLDIPIGRTVVHLPPPAVHLLPRPVPSSLTPEILTPTVVDPIQTLSVAVSHTPDRSLAKISGILKRKRAEHEMMSAARPSKIRRIQEISDLGCATEEKNRREATTTFHEIRKAQNEQCQDMDVSPPKLETGKQYVPVMEWGLSDVKEPTSPMDMPSPSRDNGWESPIAQSSDLPRQSVSVEKIDCLWADPEEELGDLSSLPDDELYHLLGDHEEEELEHLWGVSSGSVDDSVKITPKIATSKIRTPESPKVETMDMDMSGFLGKESGVKWTETIADMPRQSVSSIEMDCSWADSVERVSPMPSAVPSPRPVPSIPVPYSIPLPRPFAYTRGPARTSHGANGFRKKRIGRL